MNPNTLFRAPLALALAALLSFSTIPSLAQSASIPRNLDSRLQALVEAAENGTALSAPGVVVNGAGQVRVIVILSGMRSVTAVAAALEAAGAPALSIPDLPADFPGQRQLVVDAPVNKLAALARLDGVQAVLAYAPPKLINPTGFPPALLPMAQAGTTHVASQAAGPVGVTPITSTYDGTGQTIAVISDSYATCGATCTTTAAQDVTANNLPGAGNTAGNTISVVNVMDEANGSDEGRAMLQIIYGLAPKARLCFATAGTGPDAMAANILALAKPISKGGLCGATVIIDDIGFPSEPIFSDGVVAAAVNQVFAAGIPYLSSAGNVRGLIDQAWTPLSDTAVRAGTFGNLKFGTVPPTLTAGGFLNLSTSGGQQVSFSVVSPQASSAGKSSTLNLVLGWNDAFNGTQTSDYNVLVFDAAGNFLPSPTSATSDNFATKVPLESAVLPRSATADTTYQIVISAATTPGAAQQLRLIPGTEIPTGNLTGITQGTKVAIYGHPAAAGAIGVAAYAYNELTHPQEFSSPGPFTNYFDATNTTRLATPEVRMQPMVSGVDNVNTSFFGSDSDGDGLPNFTGTSAAAPTVAAVAALLLQAKPSLTPTQVMATLRQTARHPNTWNVKDGYGIVSAQRAINAALGTTTGQVASTTTLTSSANPVLAGVSFTLTATVSSSATTRTGTVQFFDGTTFLGGVTLTGNQAQFTTTLSFAAHSLTANYSGDASNGTSTGSLTETVSNPTLTVAGFPSVATIGTAYNVTVTAKDLSGNTLTGYTGTVTITTGDPLATITPATYTFVAADAGTKTFAITFNTSGPQTITATSTAGSTGAQTGIYVDNHLFVTRYISNTSLGRLSETGSVNFTNTATTVSVSLHRLAFDSSGNPFVMTDAGTTINKLSPATGAIVGTVTGGGLTGGRYLAIDGQSQILTANQGTMSAFDASGTAISPTTGYLAATTGRPLLFGTSVGIVIDVSGAAWIADNSNSRLIKVFGAGNPTVGPLSTGLANGTLATRP